MLVQVPRSLSAEIFYDTYRPFFALQSAFCTSFALKNSLPPLTTSAIILPVPHYP
jgi:hypothetical protein